MAKQAISRVELPEVVMLRAKTIYLEMLGEKGSGSEVASAIINSWVNHMEVARNLEGGWNKTYIEALSLSRESLAGTLE